MADYEEWIATAGGSLAGTAQSALDVDYEGGPLSEHAAAELRMRFAPVDGSATDWI
jgi:hypothetical protein